jgi:hypothetical protein
LPVKSVYGITDKKTGRPKRQARLTTNAVYRPMLQTYVRNGLPFRYVLNDCWFASAENMLFVKQALHKELVDEDGVGERVAGIAGCG